MSGEGKNGNSFNIYRFLIIATIVAIIVNIALIILPSAFYQFFIESIQFMWPLLSIVVLVNIIDKSRDKNVKDMAAVMAVALVPWTLTILLWEALLPAMGGDAMTYYISGFGFLASYIIIIYGLMRLKRSKQWHLNRSLDIFISITGAVAFIGMMALVAINLDISNPRLPDILILTLYLLSDVIILVLCSKFINMDLKLELKFLIMIVAAFTFINMTADVLFMLRWLLPLKYVFSLKISVVTDIIYNVSLIFMAAGLLIYNSNIHTRAFEDIRRKLTDTKLFVDDIIMNSPDAMCVCDPDGKVTLVNEPMLRLFNVKRDDVLRNFFMFEHWASLFEDKDAVMSGIGRGESVILPRVRLKRKDDVYLSVKLFPTLGSDGRISSYVAMIEDITERLKTEAVLRDSRKQAELYVDLMGHDINNLNQAGIGYIELAMESPEVGEDTKKMMSGSLNALKNSSKLVDNVRKLQRVKSGGGKLEPIDVGAVLDETIQDYAQVPYRNVIFSYRPVSDCLVYADDLLKDVFVNLIGNAIKHSTGPLAIGVTVEEVNEDDGKPYYRVSIEDNGPGIPDARKQTLFDRFDGESSRARGSGLGLYLVRTLVESYGGCIDIEDRVHGDHHKGVRFVVRLPKLEILPEE